MTVAGIPVTSKAVPLPGVQAPSPAPAPQALPFRFGFGYLFRRIIAYGVDTMINTTVCVLALSAVFIHQDLSWDAFSNPSLLALSILFLVMFNWAVITAQEVVFRTSLGKRMFGLGFKGETSGLFLRAFFFLPSGFFMGLGLLWALFDRRKRCWHDHALDLQPLELSELAKLG
jgi:hypothetical protein